MSSNSSNSSVEASITAWEVKGKVDYEKLVQQFGIDLIDNDLKTRFEKITGSKLHPWLRRGIFFAHRDLHKMLDAKEKGFPIYIYSGRGPSAIGKDKSGNYISASMHIGHCIPFMLTKWLQDVLDCIVIIQISDDEKFYFKDMKFEDVYKLGFENAKDIIAFGFNPKKTFIFSNRDYRLKVSEYEVLVSSMKKKVSAREVAKIFGFGEKVNVVNDKGEITERFVYDESTTVGMLDWPFYQTAAAFSQSFPHIFNNKPAHCMVIYAIDQDVYFRMSRDMASKMKLIKPSSVISVFLDPLTGPGKMSSSVGTESTIFLSDTPDQIKKKINKYAFSGGGGDGTFEDHKKYGGDPTTDTSCKYLKYFEHDDDELEKIYTGFKSADLSCSDTKKILIDKLTTFIKQHQDVKAKITNEYVEEFYKLKSLI